MGSKRTNLPAIASKVPDRTKRESRVKRFSRWMQNERINAEIYFLPYAEVLLGSLVAHGILLLAMDGSEVGRKCKALMVSVIYRKRALPIAWIVVQGNKGHFPEEIHVQLVEQVHAMMPEEADVVFLGDGEFDGITLPGHCGPLRVAIRLPHSQEHETGSRRRYAACFRYFGDGSSSL